VVPDLPYFDEILRLLEEHPESEVATAFRRHVHWGYFAEGGPADDSLGSYLHAAEQMTEQICAAGRVGDEQRVLDVGCGFGGTVAHLDERLTDCHLVGLNIDGRQLAQAQRTVVGTQRNRITFVQGDACRLPFADDTFDAVLAVECAFHFPSRRQFFREVRRVARPGASLALSDFVLADGALTEAAERATAGSTSGFYGHNARSLTSRGYDRLGRGSGFAAVIDTDITAQTLPTYAALRRLYSDAGLADGVRATDELEALAVEGLVGYHVLAFGPADSALAATAATS
jgi:SAM-dependent methyltransferase